MHKQKNKSGFTLVELLVVISIIALLVSILMPALGSARKQAMQLVCATNLRSLGQGIVMYSDENDGRLPMNFYQDLDTRRDGSNPWGSYFLGSYAASVADGSSEERWDNMMNFDDGGWVYNLGHLFAEGLLEGGIEVAYCPSNTSVSFSYKAYGGDSDFPRGVSSTSRRIRSSYSYLPQHKSRKHPAPIMADFPDVAYKISNLDSGRSMISDLLHDPANMYHGRGGIFGVNMLMGDTSVHFKLDTDDIIGDHYERMDVGLVHSTTPIPWRDVIRQLEWK